ncbi:F-box protein CPR1-like [Silene latifolia]|uniref:F-box protein CPR1-like n=1 Tax=Silene latifolia TaxID=37657 RepID=UPI003D76C335
MSMLKIRGRKKNGKKRRNKTNKTKKILQLPYLPQNVMEEIFHRLPYKAMVRFRLVCKTWNSITSSPIFMDDHYNRLSVEGTHLILLHLKRGREFNFYRVSHSSNVVDDLSSSSTAVPLEDYKTWGMSKYTLPRLIGSYNGIVAVSCQDDKLVLWNPITGQHTSVKMSVYDLHSDFNSFNPRLLFGLCYDSNTDEYNVVVGSDYQSPPVTPSNYDYDDLDYESIPVFLYSFKDGSERVLRSALSRRLLDRKLFIGESGKVIRGIPHWVVQFYDFGDDSGVETEILYFDLKEEKFNQMARPDCGVDKTMLGLAAMDGENQLGCVLHDVANTSLEVWVMKEYGNVETWTNLFIIPYENVSVNVGGTLRYMDVLGFMPSGELLLYLNDEKLWGYNVEKGNSREVKLQDGIEFSFVITFQPKFISPPKSTKEPSDKTQNEIRGSSSEEETENETNDLSSEDYR